MPGLYSLVLVLALGGAAEGALDPATPFTEHYAAETCPVAFLLPEGWTVQEVNTLFPNVCSLGLRPPGKAEPIWLAVSWERFSTLAYQEGFQQSKNEDGSTYWQIRGRGGELHPVIEGGPWGATMGTRTRYRCTDSMQTPGARVIAGAQARRVGPGGDCKEVPYRSECKVLLRPPGRVSARLVVAESCEECVEFVRAFLRGLEFESAGPFLEDKPLPPTDDMVVARAFFEAQAHPGNLLYFERLSSYSRDGGERGKAALESLIVLAKDKATRWHALSELGRIGPDAAHVLPDLLEIAEEPMAGPPRADRRHDALLAIGSIGSCPEWVAKRVVALREEPRLRGWVATTLERIEALPEIAIGPLIEILGDENISSRIQAAKALGNYPEPAAVRALRAALSQPQARHAILESLGRIGTLAADAAPDVRQDLDSPGEKFRKRAAVVLFLITGERSLPDEFEDLELEAVRLLVEHWVRLRPYTREYDKVLVRRLDSGALEIAPIVPRHMCPWGSKSRSTGPAARLVAPLVEELSSRGITVVPDCHPKGLVETIG